MNTNKDKLDDRQYERLQNLIESGRKYHYRNFVFASLVFLLLFKNENENLKLIFEVELPIKILSILLYCLTIIYTSITLDIFSSIYKTVKKDFDSEIPFNWFVLTGRFNSSISRFFLFLPFIICFIGICLSKTQIDKSSLFYLGLLGIMLPTYLKDFAYNISKKVDTRGRKITLSVYLLFWYRMVRNILFLLFLLNPIIFYLNNTQKAFNLDTVLFDNEYISIAIILLIPLRILGGLFFKKINKLGGKLGFPINYKR